MTPNTSPTITVTARALIVHDDKLLLVSNAGSFWYTPGGHIEPGENLHSCLIREVHEETGLRITPGPLLHVAEFLENDIDQHKIECYFLCKVENAQLRDEWKDVGPVTLCRFHSIDDLNDATINVQPSFLKLGAWRYGKTAISDIYQGFERR